MSSRPMSNTNGFAIATDREIAESVVALIARGDELSLSAARDKLLKAFRGSLTAATSAYGIALQIACKRRASELEAKRRLQAIQPAGDALALSAMNSAIEGKLPDAFLGLHRAVQVGCQNSIGRQVASLILSRLPRQYVQDVICYQRPTPPLSLTVGAVDGCGLILLKNASSTGELGLRFWHLGHGRSPLRLESLNLRKLYLESDVQDASYGVEDLWR